MYVNTCMYTCVFIFAYPNKCRYILGVFETHDSRSVLGMATILVILEALAVHEQPMVNTALCRYLEPKRDLGADCARPPPQPPKTIWH